MYTTAPKSVQKATRRFLDQIDPNTDWDNLDFQSDEHNARECVAGAFMLYRAEWRGGLDTSISISEWQWPFDELADDTRPHSELFAGTGPWCVLFRHAMSLLYVR